MFLEKVEIENFKSFKSFTSIDLSKLTTIIVGKNGSGKSNIIQAIKMVICCEKLNKDERLDIIHENLHNETACITLFVDNNEQRLDLQENIKIKRCINIEKDEYFLDDKLISRKEIKGILENGGISMMPYFIVQQGKINELTNMTDKLRYEFIKNISGAHKYEKERENCIKSLNEAEITKKKFSNNLKVIDDKLKNLELEKNKLEKCMNLEKEKRRYEIAYLQKELIQVNEKLTEFENSTLENESEDFENKEQEIKKLTKIIDELEKDKMNVEMYFNKIVNENENYNNKTKKNKVSLDFLNIKLEETTLQIEKFVTKIRSQENLLRKLKNEERNIFVDKIYLKNVITFFEETKTNNNSFEIEHTKELLEEKKKFILENQVNENNINFDTLNKLIEKRKELWREEKKVMSNEKNLQENLQSNQCRLITSGHFSYKVYKDVQEEKGVLGCVFDLFEIPEELFAAFEAVAGNTLFNIVVSDENVISELLKKIKSSASFIPLSKITEEKPKELNEENVFLLSSKITPKISEYSEVLKNLINFITKFTYVVPDIKTANVLSKKHNINTVTPEGDTVRKSGIISGGYENRTSVIKEYKKIINLKNENSKKLEYLKKKISNLSIEIETIEKIQKQNSGTLGEMEMLLSIVRFLEEKIKILGNKGHKKQYYENKLENVSYKSVGLNSQILKIENEIEELKKDKEEVEKENNKIRQFIESFTRYKELDSMHKKLEQLKLSTKSQNSQQKEALIHKKQSLLEKIGVDDKLIFPDLTEETIANKLKSINEELKNYIFLNRRNLDQWTSFIDQKNDLLKKQKDLLENYDTIKNFIKSLDEKKEEKMNLTFENVKANFEMFSKKLCNFNVKLVSESSSLSILADEGDNKTLSGGQKTMVSIAIIFSIQKLDPSPFYIFDEVDANLDEEGRIRLCNLFRSSTQSQLIMTTFHKELLSIGDKYLGVSYSDKKSYASEVTREVAYNFLQATE